MISSERKILKRNLGISSISFGSLTVREYAIGVGDSPSISRGIPISLKGGYVRELKYSIDAYEALYPNRRQGIDLVLSPLEREMLLARQGYSMKEIFRNIDFIQKLRSNERKKGQKKNRIWNRMAMKMKKMLVCRIFMTMLRKIRSSYTFLSCCSSQRRRRIVNEKLSNNVTSLDTPNRRIHRVSSTSVIRIKNELETDSTSSEADHNFGQVL